MQKPSTLTAASITASFPNPIISPIATVTSPPTYASTICLAQTQLNDADATTVPSYAGDGIHGHLALTLLPAAFLLCSGNVPFIAPLNGPVNPIHPAAATAAQIAEINHRVFYSTKTSRSHSTPTRKLTKRYAIKSFAQSPPTISANSPIPNSALAA